MPRRTQSENLDTARQQQTVAQATDATADEPESRPHKANPMAQALKLRGALDKIDKREGDYIRNAKVRYQIERDQLLDAASERVLAILKAAEEEAE